MLHFYLLYCAKVEQFTAAPWTGLSMPSSGQVNGGKFKRKSRVGASHLVISKTYLQVMWLLLHFESKP